MINRGVGLILAVITVGSVLTGCNAPPQPDSGIVEVTWPGEIAELDPTQREVTVVIALSSIVPGGVVGHAGVAVDTRYWDFGPRRVERFQRLKAIESKAGPWWDDPAQDWQTDRTLLQVLDAMPGKIKPTGSIVAVFRCCVTQAQAEALEDFWEQTYERMHEGEERYALRARQCANMVGWSLDAALAYESGCDRPMPAEYRMMTPTKLYESLAGTLRHTAGPQRGEPAELTLWQLNRDGLKPWRRPTLWDRLGVRELPRTRLAIERVKHLPLVRLALTRQSD